MLRSMGSYRDIVPLTRVNHIPYAMYRTPYTVCGGLYGGSGTGRFIHRRQGH